ncbi:MAG TPA: 50S ribosomal protein L4 [Gammaproteobacteria bacterium]|nr:50S ribosomal protein L4 [Gammaproteobacteria bacterium]
MALDGKKTKNTVTLNESLYSRPFSETLVHQVITGYMAGARQGSKQNKSRSDVAGGGAKPWKQKGTGRARAGTLSSPIFRSGGVTFAARPRSWTQKLNKKMYRAAMQCILSEFVRTDSFFVVENLDMATAKTRDALKLLPKNSKDKVLFIGDDISENFYFSVRNLAHVWLSDIDGLDPLSLYQASRVIVTKESLSRLEELYHDVK